MCHDSTAAVPCAKSCSEHFAWIEMRVHDNFHPYLNDNGKYISEMGPLSSSSMIITLSACCTMVQHNSYIDGSVQDCSISIAGDTAVLHWAINIIYHCIEEGEALIRLSIHKPYPIPYIHERAMRHLIMFRCKFCQTLHQSHHISVGLELIKSIVSPMMHLNLFSGLLCMLNKLCLNIIYK